MATFLDDFGNYLGNLTGLHPNAPATSGFSGGQVSAAPASTYVGNNTAYIPGQGFIATNGLADTPQGVLSATSGNQSSFAAPSAPAAAPAGGPPLVSQGLPSAPDTGMFDSIIQPALQALEGGVGAANSAYDAAVSQANQQGTTAKNQAQANTQENLNTLGQRQTSEENTSQNAVQEAQRGYSEISQGIQSRYGGTTGTGAFANEIVGAATQKNIASYRNQLAQSIDQINQAKEHVNLVGQQAVQDIENETQTRIAQAKSQLDNQIAQIRTAQGQLASRKAELVSGAIQDYQRLVAQANQLDTQFKQSLYMQQQAAQQKLATAVSAQTQRVQALQLKGYSPTENVMVFNPNTGQYTPVNGGQASTTWNLPGNQKPVDNTDPFLNDVNSPTP